MRGWSEGFSRPSGGLPRRPGLGNDVSEGHVPGISPQQLLTQWVVGSLIVGGVLLLGGARAPGAALVGSSFCSFLAFLLKGLYGGKNLETLVHGAVIAGSVGLVVFGLAGLRGAAGEVRRRRRIAEDFGVPRFLVGAPLGRYPVALALAFGTVVVGAELDPPDSRRTDGGPRSRRTPSHGFEEPWVRPLLAFDVAFLALLFLVQAWQASRSSGEHEQEDDTASGVVDPSSQLAGRRSSCRCGSPRDLNRSQVPPVDLPGDVRPAWHVDEEEGTSMAEPSLYERLGGVFAIAAVIDHFSDAVVQNSIVGQASENPELREWHTNQLGRLPGLKFMRTLWVCNVAGGPFTFAATKPGSTPLGLEEAHRELRISPEEFDEVAAELGRSLDHFGVPPREKDEVLAAFAAHKGEVTEGSMASA